MQSVSKSIIGVAVLAAISSSSAIAQQVGVDQTDPYGLGSYTIVGTPNQAYDLDKMQQDAQVAADAKVTADKANADILKMGKQVEDNRLNAATNSVRIKHLETEASILNGQAVQLRQDVNINTKALSVLGGNVQQLQGQIGNFVTKPEFKTDQDRQDQIVTALTNTVSSKANQADVDANKQAITADEANITANKSAIDTEVKAEQQHFSTLSSGVQQAQTTGAAAQNRADVAFANAEANHQALANTNQRLADDEKTLANHEQRISDLEANNQTNFNSLKDQQNKDRKEFRAGLAGAFALTAIPQAPQGHTVGFGMGVGTFNGQNAVSAGISARVSANVSVKTGLSWDTADNVGAGAGVLFSY